MKIHSTISEFLHLEIGGMTDLAKPTGTFLQLCFLQLCKKSENLKMCDLYYKQTSFIQVAEAMDNLIKST
jgi:hypothetical protein